jgi:hypothetical protein
MSRVQGSTGTERKKEIQEFRSCSSSGVAEFKGAFGGWTRLLGHKQPKAWRLLPEAHLHLQSMRIPNPESKSDSIELFERALRDVEKPCFVAHSALPESFCNVGRNRNGSAPNLVRQAINLTFGKASRERINCEDQSVCFLPYHQVLECLCRFCHVEENDL